MTMMATFTGVLLLAAMAAARPAHVPTATDPVRVIQQYGVLIDSLHRLASAGSRSA